MRDLRELKAWDKGHLLTPAPYQVAAPFPWDELRGLAGQMRRSSASIPANIAKGCGRHGNVELARFLRTLWALAGDLEYCLCSHTISDYSTIQSTNALPGR